MAVSDRPWSEFSASDYTPEQWRRAYLVDTGEGDEDSKSRYKLPVREPDGTLNRNAVHAAAGGHGISAVQGISMEEKRRVAKKLASLYRNDLDEDPPESLQHMAGGSMGRSSTLLQRSFPLDDIQVRGDGRTVEAYAAVFDVETEVRDQQGHYREAIGRSAFAKTVRDRGTRFGVFYNHGKTLHGTPSERGSMPLGTPVEPPRADGRGLITVTRYNKTALADEVLESIRNGDITGQSFTGRAIKSDPAVPRGGYRPGRDGALPLVTRSEIALVEYGPTPVPQYDEPMMLSVRSASAEEYGWQTLLAELGDLDDEVRAEFARALGFTPSLATPPANAEPVEVTATPEVGAGADEPHDVHSGRSVQARIRAARITRGM